MCAQAARWNRIAELQHSCGQKKIFSRKYWHLYWSSTWSCVSTLDCGNCVICGCSHIYLSISQARHASSERDDGFSLILQMTVDSAVWLGQRGQNHPLTATPLKYWCALRNSHTSHLHRPFMLYTKIDSKMHLYKRLWHLCSLNQASSIGEATRLNCFLSTN